MRATLELDGTRFDVQLRHAGDRLTADVGDETFVVQVARNGQGTAVTVGSHVFLVGDADGRTVVVDGRRIALRIMALVGVAGADAHSRAAHGPVHAPMTGRLVEVAVRAGETVAAGDVLFVLEAMKMRNEVRSPGDGVVRKVHRMAGETVGPSVAVLELGPPTAREK